MAVLTTYLLPSVLTPEVDHGLFSIGLKKTINNSAANGSAYPQNADNIQLLTITRNARLLACYLRAVATLGAGATIKLQKNTGGVRTDLTIATTAAAVTSVSGITLLPVDLVVGDIIEALVGGANVSAAAGIEVDLNLQH